MLSLETMPEVSETGGVGGCTTLPADSDEKGFSDVLKAIEEELLVVDSFVLLIEAVKELVGTLKGLAGTVKGLGAAKGLAGIVNGGALTVSRSPPCNDPIEFNGLEVDSTCCTV